MSSMEIGSIGAGAAGTSWDEFGPILSLEDTESPDSVWLQVILRDGVFFLLLNFCVRLLGEGMSVFVLS